MSSDGPRTAQEWLEHFAAQEAAAHARTMAAALLAVFLAFPASEVLTSPGRPGLVGDQHRAGGQG